MTESLVAALQGSRVCQLVNGYLSWDPEVEVCVRLSFYLRGATELFFVFDGFFFFFSLPKNRLTMHLGYPFCNQGWLHWRSYLCLPGAGVTGMKPIQG